MNKTMRTPEGWSKQKIQASLARHNLNQAAIARALKISPTTVSDVIAGNTVSGRIHKAIAEAIGEDIKTIWPQHYLHGTPKRGRKMITWVRNAA